MLKAPYRKRRLQFASAVRVFERWHDATLFWGNGWPIWSPRSPWCWKIYLQNCANFGANVSKYSNTWSEQPHLALCLESANGRFLFGFPPSAFRAERYIDLLGRGPENFSSVHDIYVHYFSMSHGSHGNGNGWAQFQTHPYDTGTVTNCHIHWGSKGPLISRSPDLGWTTALDEGTAGKKNVLSMAKIYEFLVDFPRFSLKPVHWTAV